MTSLLAEFLKAFLRWALTGVGMWFVQKGILSPEQADQMTTQLVVGIATAILPLVWSLWQKYLERRLLNTAIAMSPVSTLNDLKKTVASGAAAKASTPPDKAPSIEIKGDK